MSTSNAIDHLLHNWPIVQTVHSLFILCALPPVLLLLFLLRNAALHVNCKFLLYAWISALLVSVFSHAAHIAVHIISGNYIPKTSSDPEVLLIVFGVHGFVHAFSSAQELLFSIERAFACANPSAYHDRSFSKLPLIVSEIAAIAVAYVYSRLISAGNKLLIACVITNTIDFLSLVCLVITKIWTDRKMRNLLLSGLNEKYQIREAFEITRVMLPCGLISLIMKLLAMTAAWMYGLRIIKSQYDFVICSGLYFIIETSNCLICSIVFLRSHPKLRQCISKLFCLREVRVHPRSTQIASNLEQHFESLKEVWKSI